MRTGKWRAGNIRPAGMVSEDRKKVRKERREFTGLGKQAREEEGTLPGAVEHMKLQGEEQRQYYNIDQCLHSLFLIPSAGFTFCSSQHGSSFVFIIGEKLEKLHPQSQCLVPTSAAGSGSSGHGAPKEPLQIKSFTACLAAEGYF